MIDIDSQFSIKYNSDTALVLVDDNDDSKCDTEENDVESATEDEVNSDVNSLERDKDVAEETDGRVDTGDASVVESKEESKEESEEESEDGSDDDQYLDGPNKEEYGAIVETYTNPDFHVMVDMILHRKVTTAHVTSPNGTDTVYAIGKADVRKKLERVFAKRIEHGQDYTWVLQKKKETTKKIVSKWSFAEGFNPGQHWQKKVLMQKLTMKRYLSNI